PAATQRRESPRATAWPERARNPDTLPSSARPTSQVLALPSPFPLPSRRRRVASRFGISYNQAGFPHGSGCRAMDIEFSVSRQCNESGRRFNDRLQLTSKSAGGSATYYLDVSSGAASRRPNGIAGSRNRAG